MSAQVLLLGGPEHLKVWDVREILPCLRMPDRPKPMLTFDFDDVTTMTHHKTVTYLLHRWRWADGSLLNVYSCIDDEYWMREHVRVMGDQLRRVTPWFGPDRIDLAMEFEKLWREVDAKLMNSDYAKNRTPEQRQQVKLKFDILKRKFNMMGPQE